jgi:predicted ATPase/DNA-binding XRE family transcriptional regulator
MGNTTKPEPAPFGALLLRSRAAAGLTQEQLAARAGLSPAAISALESGKRRAPRFATIELLAAALALDEQDRRALISAARVQADPRPRTRDGGSDGGPRLLTLQSIAEAMPLVDRVDELDLIVRSLTEEDARVLTLLGPAGVGKTRLAVAAAARFAASDGGGRFPDGVTLIDLTPVREPDMVPVAIARAFGLIDVGGLPVCDRLLGVLAERRQLVVLDNLEQVLPGAASPIADLLAACPRLAFLVTSRVPLRLRSEQTLRVAPLPVPDAAWPLPPSDVLLAIPSVALFVARARAYHAAFVLTDQDMPLVAQLVTQLDGLPLALELAAARLDVLSLPALVSRLDDRLQLLASQAPDAPERQRSLEAAVGWSYDLLSEPEQRLFRCLGVFVGRVSLDAIAAVVGAVAAEGLAASDRETREAGEAIGALPRLLSLAEKSLLLPVVSRREDSSDLREFFQPPEPQGPAHWPTRATTPEGEDRELAFGALETVREYAWERLEAAGELPAAQRAHANYFLSLAERADPALRGRDQRDWYLRLEHEHDNLRAALRWSVVQAEARHSEGSPNRKTGLRLAAALGYFWYVRGYHSEGRRWLEELLACTSGKEDVTGAGSATRMRALIAAGPLLMVQAEYAQALAVLKEALALAERSQDQVAIAQASTYLGHAATVAGYLEEGTRRLQDAVRRWKALPNPNGLGETLFYLGYAADIRGDAPAAAAHYRAALRRLGDAGNAQHAGFVHSYLGVLEWRRGKLSSAVAHIQAVLQTSVALQDRWLLSFAAQAAVVIVGSSARIFPWARLLGAADALAQATGGATFGWEHLPGSENVTRLREQLGQDRERNEAYRTGLTLPSSEVAALALTLLGAINKATPSPRLVGQFD